jgi:hypothetical protein
MALQKSHGRSYPLVSVPDELPDAVPEARRPEEAAAPVAQRGEGGLFASGEGTRQAGRRGGLARVRRQAAIMAAGTKLKLARYIKDLRPSEHLAPFVKEAERWLDATARELAASTGGGRLSPMVTGILQSAAWARAYSNFFLDAASRDTWLWQRNPEGQGPALTPKTDLALAGMRLATESRQHCIAAWEMAAREAQSRPGVNAIEALRAEFEGGEDGK